jgi:hypothetical protein
MTAVEEPIARTVVHYSKHDPLHHVEQAREDRRAGTAGARRRTGAARNVTRVDAEELAQYGTRL